MKPPKKVKVAAHTYRIARSKKKTEGDEGRCQFTETSIYIMPRLPLAKEQEVLLHELLHACAYPGIGDEDAPLEEKFVTIVAPVLLQVIQENPELIEFLRYRGKVKPAKSDFFLKEEK